jgi:hypothetical protein
VKPKIASKGHTIAILFEGVVRKITKILFARDGSYMVAVPYHNSNKGVLFKIPVTYSRILDEEISTPFSAVIDAGKVDEKRVKLSHHRSGFVQFSGEGVKSGFDEQGQPRGIGVKSWPLENPAPGPSFGVTLLGLHYFRPATSSEVADLRAEGILFDADELPPCVGANGFVLEGFYYPPKARRFVKLAGATASMQIVHPVGVIMDLKVVLSDPSKCDFPGLIGLTLYPIPVKFGEEKSGYMISSSTGNLRRNDCNELVGDGLYCAFPDGMQSLHRRDLTFERVSLQYAASSNAAKNAQD